MIVETALRIAGAGSHLVHVARRTGVLHVYTGPLTPSGRYVPKGRRTVCRAHTRRLAVLPVESSSSSLDPANPWRVCVRCSARLSRSVLKISSSRRAERPHRSDHARAHAGTTPADLLFALDVASTPAEVDAVAHLSLLLFGHHGSTQPVAWRDGSTRPSLHHHIKTLRSRYTERSDADRAFDEVVTSSYAQLKAERHQRYHDREERIARLGINLATRR